MEWYVIDITSIAFIVKDKIRSSRQAEKRRREAVKEGRKNEVEKRRKEAKKKRRTEQETERRGRGEQEC
jgi:hypothetical protein